MAPAEEKYRRLPGRRRGVISGASLWMGQDHILMVKTAWFREEYKRFYLRDIQAIVVAPGARFYISIPVLVLALAWLFSGFFMAFWPTSVAIGWIAGTTAMLAAWLGVSIAAGCRCRLYTAVSKDELPSVFRTWTARRFLRQVQPLIEQVQGTVDAGWAEAERTSAGPLLHQGPGAMAPMERQPRSAAPSRTLASDLFALTLVVTSAVGLATVGSADIFWNRVNTALTIVQLAGAVVVLVQYSRGNIGKAMQRVAVVSMLLTGVTFYVQTFTFAIINGARIGSGLGPMAQVRPYVMVHQVTYGLNMLLGLISAVITLRGAYSDEPDIIKD
jgi:hypothetical protein